jgi:hypothetical protein
MEYLPMAPKKPARTRKNAASSRSAPSPPAAPNAANSPEDLAAEHLRFLRAAAKVAHPTEKPTPQEAEDFFRLLPKYGRFEVDGINPPGGKRVPVTNRDYKVLAGKTATVCPRARPQIGPKLAGELADSLRRRGLIRPGETIHFTGPQAEADSICECDLAATQAAAGAGRGPGPETVTWTPPNGIAFWAKLFGVNRNTMATWLKQQKYRNFRVTRQNYRLAIEDLPPAHRKRFLE